MEVEQIFQSLFNAQTEAELEQFIQSNKALSEPKNWFPIGGLDSNYGIIENQQSNPIAALVEKVTNSIDAILMRKCLEAEINPKSKDAPRSMDEAVQQFYPDHKSWDLTTFRRKQAEEIQLLADGPTKESSVIIYDNGEGQHPEEFENTFLSLMRGNKNEIHFVQGKYNMGGSGAIVFCGKKGYQLIASKRYSGDGKFGFTLVREHPLTTTELTTKKNTWYEYLKVDDKIPSFSVKEIDLNLYGRNFSAGTVIKLYSYQMKGIYGFAQELSQSLNEFLFKPILPFLTVDRKERYPNNPVLEATVFGLQRRLEDETDYVEDWFSEEYSDSLFGFMKVTCYVFKAKQENKSVKDSKDDIKRRFFKNGMSVLFSMNGQVHGNYTTEFITKGLKFSLLKNYLLINVDCTRMKYEFRKELFMASRDRLKEGDEAKELRDYLRKKLSKSKLSDINKHRKEAIGFESEDTSELIKSFSKNLPKNSDLYKLLQNTLTLEEKKKSEKPKETAQKNSKRKEERPFKPERFPSYFRLYNKKDNVHIPVPIGGEKTLKFETDVENHYFDRTEEPGDLQVAVLTIKNNETEGATDKAKSTELSSLINIVKSSPNQGTIKITFNPDTELKQGDEVEIRVSLKGLGEDYIDEIVWLKIVDKEAKSTSSNTSEEENMENIGLPELVKVQKDKWESLEQIGISMDHNTVLFPLGEADKLDKIYVNLDSNVFLTHRSKLKTENQIIIAQKKYLASVYFHSLFLYIIAKRKNYKFTTVDEDKEEEQTIDEYIRALFDSYYSDFLLNFGLEELINSIEE